MIFANLSHESRDFPTVKRFCIIIHHLPFVVVVQLWQGLERPHLAQKVDFVFCDFLNFGEKVDVVVESDV